VGAVHVPLKRGGGLIRKLFVQGQAEPKCFQVGKVIGGQDLALDNGEVDFDLIEPTGVDRRMNHNDPGIDVMQPLRRGGTAGGRAHAQKPLSSIQNSRSPDRYGSSASTWLTSRPNGAMPVVGSHRPITCPRRTSHAARYCRAPPRSYSVSIY